MKFPLVYTRSTPFRPTRVACPTVWVLCLLLFHVFLNKETIKFLEEFIDSRKCRYCYWEKYIIDNPQARRKQYGLQRCVKSTINLIRSNNILTLYIEKWSCNSIFRLWGQSEVILILRRTRVVKNTIVNGTKEYTINILVAIIQTKSQQGDSTESMLELVVINGHYNLQGKSGIPKR